MSDTIVGKISNGVKNKRIHFIGIGGIGMSGIAQLCLKKGYRVSGSDLVESETVKKLKKSGAHIHIGHHRSHIANPGVVVYSSAIKSGNPELEAAKRRGIPLMRRADLLASLMKNQVVIAVTGAHGKTTTSSLVAHLLATARMSPTIAVGGVLTNITTNAQLGAGTFFVAEADESDGTFLAYDYTYSIITNIDREHLDFYKTFSNVKAAFKQFILRGRREGCVFWCYDDSTLAAIMKNVNPVRKTGLSNGVKRKNISFGLSGHADIVARNIECRPFSSSFDVFYRRAFLQRFSLSLAGRHNISNALSVIALGMELGISRGLIQKALESFSGVKRRFQKKYNHNDILIIDDYAHHPTEIRTTLQAARGLNRKRLLTVFQPHRYSRMKYLLKQFSTSFFNTDYLFLTDIYPAGEKKIKGVNARRLYALMKKKAAPQTKFFRKHMLVDAVTRFLKKGDVVFFLGAGDINKISDAVVKKLKGKSKA